MAAISEDLPALGKPTSPTSATLLSSRTRSRFSPGSPSKANPGALRRVEASAALPRPPRPPCAATNRLPAPVRSASTSPSSSSTTVPSGTRSSRSSPSAPLRLLPAPCLPLPAFWCGWWWKSSSVWTLASTTRITSPPRPPLPPSGPPSGLNFSRWTEATPWPPLPAVRCSTTRSTKLAMVASSLGHPVRTHEGRLPVARGRPVMVVRVGAWCRARSDARRDDVHGLASAREAELHRTRLEGEQRVVLAPADAGARVELGAALADEDLAGLDHLAPEALDAQELRVGVAAVAG